MGSGGSQKGAFFGDDPAAADNHLGVDGLNVRYYHQVGITAGGDASDQAIQRKNLGRDSSLDISRPVIRRIFVADRLGVVHGLVGYVNEMPQVFAVDWQ